MLPYTLSCIWRVEYDVGMRIYKCVLFLIPYLISVNVYSFQRLLDPNAVKMYFLYMGNYAGIKNVQVCFHDTKFKYSANFYSSF